MESEAAVSQIVKAQNGLHAINTALIIAHFLFPKQAKLKNGDTFDFIIAGGGTAGCVLASRLALKNFTVALLEAGDNPPIETFYPNFVVDLMKSVLDWNHTAVQDSFTKQCHRSPTIGLALGRCLGGTGSVNFMQASKGNCRDYHRWALAANDSSWELKNLKPLFKRSIKLYKSSINDMKKRHGLEPYHPNGFGKYKIGMQVDDRPIIKKYLQAFQEIGNNLIEDPDGFQPKGYRAGVYNILDGTRQSTAYKYLVPAGKYTNLVVARNTLVTKIIIDKHKIARGVIAVYNNRKLTLKARKEVIVSAGAVKSPQLLMLSGIGRKKHLKENHIQVVSDLPVGENLQSTIGVVIIYKTQQSIRDPKDLDYHLYPTPTLVGFTSLRKCNKYPDYGTVTYVQSRRTMLMQYCAFTYDYKHKICNKLYDLLPDSEVAFTVIYNLYPKSRGKILLRSADPYEAPKVYTGHYSDPRDMKTQIASLRDFVRIVNSTYYKEIEASRIDLTKCSEYEQDSDDYWKCYSLCLSAEVWNHIGTCAMGRVVDSKLHVHGVHRLRVVDASVIPSPVAGWSYLATVIVADKAADMITAEHKES